MRSLFKKTAMPTGPAIQKLGLQVHDEAQIIGFADLDDISVASLDILQDTFHLTLAEARLAQQLARGDSLPDVANLLGIKMSTARTQIAAIFSKTYTRRQAKLVALLGRLANLAG